MCEKRRTKEGRKSSFYYMSSVLHSSSSSSFFLPRFSLLKKTCYCIWCNLLFLSFLSRSLEHISIVHFITILLLDVILFMFVCVKEEVSLSWDFVSLVHTLLTFEKLGKNSFSSFFSSFSSFISSSEIGYVLPPCNLKAGSVFGVRTWDVFVWFVCVAKVSKPETRGIGKKWERRTV